MIGAPDPIVVDAASEADRKWFAGNLLRQHRLRPFFDGEMEIPPVPSGAQVWIAVRQIEPGVRMRVPVLTARTPEDSEETARFVFYVVASWAE